MSLEANELWANQNPPQPLSGLSSQAQTDVGQGYQCGQPMNPEALNFELNALGVCAQSQMNEIVALTVKAGTTYDDGVTTNLRDGVCAIVEDAFCDFYTNRVFSQTVSGLGGTLSVQLPAVGSWDYTTTLIGAADATFNAVSGGFFQPLAPREKDPDGDVNYGGSSAGNAAGGTVFDATQPGDGFGTLSVFAIRVDC